jgi:acetyltransferase-like isoleucine patch superfamily enzyme
MLSRYGLWGVLYLIFCKVVSKFIFPQARLIRLPTDIRNKKFMRVGSGLTIGKGCRIEVETSHWESLNREPCLIIGENVRMNDYCHITSGESVIIEDNVLIASRVYISDLSHGAYGKNNIHHSPLIIPNDRPFVGYPVVIKQNVWLGEGVCILPGVTVGEGSIIGSNSVVSRSIPPYSIAGGIPAIVLKKFDFTIQKWIDVKHKKNGDE